MCNAIYFKQPFRRLLIKICRLLPEKIKLKLMDRLYPDDLEISFESSICENCPYEDTDKCDTCSERKCRICGCTWDQACPGGCYWVDWNLCSKCADKYKL